MIQFLITTAALSDSTPVDTWNFPFKLFTIPLMEKELSYDSVVEERIFKLGRQQINAIFTSQVAVKSVFERLEERPDWQIYCLQGKTRSALLKFVPETLIVDGSAQNSTALAAEIKAGPEPLRQRPTVFFCGDRRMPGLPAAFKELEIPLEELVCYKTTCSPSNLNGDFAGFLFFSPSAVDCFFTHNASVNQSAVLFAIGETTAKSITKYCNNKVIVAPEPSETALLNEVKIYFEALKISESN